MSVGGVRRLAAEVDIPTKYVGEAACALDRPQERAGSRIFGIPASFELQQTVPGEVPQQEYGVLLDVVRDSFGQQGNLDTTVDTRFSCAQKPGAPSPWK